MLESVLVISLSGVLLIGLAFVWRRATAELVLRHEVHLCARSLAASWTTTSTQERLKKCQHRLQKSVFHWVGSFHLYDPQLEEHQIRLHGLVQLEGLRFPGTSRQIRQTITLSR